MPVQSYTMGPGTLTLGAGPLAIEAQLTSFKVTASENVSEGEVIPVLSGDELRENDDVSLSWSVSGNVFQDLDAAGLVAYTWTNARDEVAFTFVPNTVEGRQVTGTVRLVPIEVGGDVKTKPRSDFTWRCTGDDPVLGDAA